MDHELSRAPLSRFLFALLGGLTIAACGNSSAPGGDASRDTNSPRDITVPDSTPRDIAAPDAPNAETSSTQAAAPVFAPAGGVYSDPQKVSIASGSAGAQIRYTMDGTDPTAASPVYTGPITVSVTSTIKAIAIDPTGALLNSPVVSATYTFAARVPPPTFSIPAGTYASQQLVTVSDSNINATIHYTVDGTEPTATSTVYTMPITVSTTMTIKAIATLTGMVDSLVSSALYTIQTLAPAATPTFKPAAGSYAGPQDVTIATTTPGAEIYYSLDGTDPTQASTLYQAPVHIANSAVVKARAYATGTAPSAIATAAYTITAQAATKPTISPNGGTFTAAQQVTLSTTETGGQIIYTTDGSIPNTTTGTIYTTPFTLAQTATVNAIVVNVPGKDPSAVATAVFTINIALPVAFDKQTGTYNNDVSVAITTTAAGATVCYTKDGSDPSCSTTGTCATGQSTAGVPVVITGNAPATGTVVRARACKAGLPAGPIVAQTYTMVAANVVFTPAGSTVAIGTAVTMSSITTGAEIRYREDTTDPTCTTGTVYSAAIVLNQSKQFRAIACKANYTASAVTNASYGVKLTTPIALQLNGAQYAAVAATATVSNSIGDLIFALGGNVTAVANQTLCYSVNGTAPACTTSGTCDTSVTGLFSRTLQTTADPIYGKLSNIVGDSATAVTIAAPAGASATLAVKAAFCAPNYTISDVSTVTYTFKVATPTLSRASGTTTLAGENANNTIASTTASAKLRYYKIASGDTAPTLSCTGAVPTGVTEVDSNTITIHVSGGDSVAAIACRTNYNPSDAATANYPLPGTTAAPAFSTQGTTAFANDITAGLIKITDSDIANVGDTVLAPAGVVCWTMADSGTVSCNEHATTPTCVTPPSPGGTYTWDSSVSPAVSNLPAVGASGVRLRAVACAPGKTKSAVTSQTFSFQVADVTITPPPQANTTTIGIGESLTFSTTTTGATLRYTKGTSGAPPANPNCSTVGTVGSSYAVTAGDASNGSLIVKVIACKNQYTASGITTSNTYTSFRGAAVVFGIPAGTYGDVLETASSNTPSGPQSVSVADATGLVRICVTKNGVVPTCTNGNNCAGLGTGGSASDIIGGAAGIANNATLPWSTFDTSGLTLRAQACYTGRADPPVTVSGPYNFQVAPLTITNTTPAPNSTPFSKTQRIVFRVGNEASSGAAAVKAPADTAAGPVQLCYTSDGSALGTGCSTSGSMTCVPMAMDTVSAVVTRYLSASETITAKACKSTMTPSTASAAISITPYARTLNMSGGNDFVGHEGSERFATTTATTHFFTSWDATSLYLGWQGCGLNNSNTADADNFALAYLGVPGQQGITVGTGAFVAGTARGARWQVKYNVGTNVPQIRIRNFSGNSWDLVSTSGITAVHGAGTSAACTDATDNTGDFVIVRIPLATLGSPAKFAIAEGINVGIPAEADNADVAGWPATAAVFDAPAAIFDLKVWQPPTGATGCDDNGIGNTPTCQVAP